MNENFLEFIKFYIPNFFKFDENLYQFCYKFRCNSCKIGYRCDKNLIFLTEQEYQDVKLKYPEYFV